MVSRLPAVSLGGGRRRRAWVLLAPSLLAAALVAGWPLLRTFGLAFGSGFDDFALVLTDPDWWRAVGNTLAFTVASVALEFALGLGFALLLNAGLKGAGALTAVALIPWAVPTVVAAKMWSWMYHDVYGVVNDLALRLGLIEAPVAWLADPGSAMAAVVLTDVWKATPFVTLLLLAGLRTIPPQLYDAARADGAGPLGCFLYVTLPLLRPAILIALTFRSLDALRVFDLIYVMTTNSRTTATVSVYARQLLIDFQETGPGAAASVLIFALVGLAAVAYVAALRPAMEPAR